LPTLLPSRIYSGTFSQFSTQPLCPSVSVLQSGRFWIYAAANFEDVNNVFTTEFDYNLPDELIAQAPATQRDQSRLLVLDRNSGQIAHREFREFLDYLRPGDVLVLNNSRVIPARLRGANLLTGGQFEILLLEEVSHNDWWVMLRPGKRARVGTQIVIRNNRGEKTDICAVVLETNVEGHRRIRIEYSQNILSVLDSLGEVPLPPYISRANGREMESDRSRYQTVFAESPGSVAAPTAGLHFTESFLDEIRSRNVHVCFVTLHVGLGTFAPVKAERLSAHKMHEERFEIPASTAQIVNEAKCDGRRVIAVGTTTVRVLESVAAHVSENPSVPRVKTGSGRTRMFIYPPYDFKIVNALLTNFHLPRSTLLILVSAFAAPKETRGRNLILSAYAEAIEARYRFFSYGDAMFIV
jgi:S-adenosylmethionine:tRNA ribosyltransferase-isomerase